MPVLQRCGINSENPDFNCIFKIKNNFKSYFSACLGILSMSTFEKKKELAKGDRHLNKELSMDIF